MHKVRLRLVLENGHVVSSAQAAHPGQSVEGDGAEGCESLQPTFVVLVEVRTVRLVPTLAAGP